VSILSLQERYLAEKRSVVKDSVLITMFLLKYY
jgi:hypothetical protein